MSSLSHSVGKTWTIDQNNAAVRLREPLVNGTYEIGDPHENVRCCPWPRVNSVATLFRERRRKCDDAAMETVNSEQLDWHKLRTVGSLDTDVLPVAVQDADTREIIMIAYLSREALVESARTGRAVFYSTSRHLLHRKGETSGDVLEVVSLRANCDLNSVLMEVRKQGIGACHERDTDGNHYTSCFFRELVLAGDDPGE